MTITNITLTSVYQGIIQVPIFAAPYTIAANTGTAHSFAWIGNTTGDTPFADNIAYAGRGPKNPSGYYDTPINGTMVNLGYPGAETLLIGGGYSLATGYKQALNRGSIFDGYYQAIWETEPDFNSTGNQAGMTQFNIGLTQYPLAGNVNTTSFGMGGAIVPVAAQFNTEGIGPAGPAIDQNSSANVWGGSTFAMRGRAEVLVSNGTTSYDTFLQANVSLTIFATNELAIYAGWICPSLNVNYTGQPLFPTNPDYVVTNLNSFAFNSGILLSTKFTGQNFLWFPSSAGTSIFIRPFGMQVIYQPISTTPETEHLGFTLNGVGDWYSTNGSQFVFQFDNPALNADIASENFRMTPGNASSLMLFSTQFNDYVISADGTQYWQLQYVPQITGITATSFSGYQSADVGKINQKFIDANGVFWYTGGAYNNAAATGVITPLYSYSAFNTPQTLPAFPPLQLPCFASCLATGSVMAKQTAYG